MNVKYHCISNGLKKVQKPVKTLLKITIVMHKLDAIYLRDVDILYETKVTYPKN